MMNLLLAALCGGLTAVGSGLPAGDDGIRLIGVVNVPATAVDTSGLTEPCGPALQNRFGGWGSAIEWTGNGDRYLVQPDRGPNNGAEEYKCRSIEVTIKVEDESTKRASLTVEKTTLLRNGKYSLVGLSNVYDSTDPGESLRFDPEGVRLGEGGTIYISDEYGPLICAFGPDGQRLRVLPVPKKFQIAHPNGKATEEDLLNTSGRVANRGLEGLAISRDKKTLWSLLQSPLIQDGGREGENLRLLKMYIASGATSEYPYVLDNTKVGCNEVLAVDDHTFLTIERDGKDGNDAKFKKIMLIDVEGATDVSKIEKLPVHGLPDGVKAVRKRVLIDLLDAKWGLAGASLPEKVEGLAFGPDRPDGSRTLVITTDNDFRDDQPSCVWVFAVPPAAVKFEVPAVRAGR